MCRWAGLAFENEMSRSVYQAAHPVIQTGAVDNLARTADIPQAVATGQIERVDMIAERDHQGVKAAETIVLVECTSQYAAPGTADENPASKFRGACLRPTQSVPGSQGEYAGERFAFCGRERECRDGMPATLGTSHGSND